MKKTFFLLLLGAHIIYSAEKSTDALNTKKQKTSSLYQSSSIDSKEILNNLFGEKPRDIRTLSLYQSSLFQVHAQKSKL